MGSKPNRGSRHIQVLMTALACLAPLGAVRADCLDGDSPRTGDYSVEREFQRARYVATVKVTGETWVEKDGAARPLAAPFQFTASRPWDSPSHVGVFYDVEVLTGFKGEPPRRLRLFSRNTTARAPMTVGRSYLAFIDEAPEPALGNQVANHIDNCGNSTRLETATRPLRSVRALASRRPSSALR